MYPTVPCKEKRNSFTVVGVRHQQPLEESSPSICEKEKLRYQSLLVKTPTRAENTNTGERQVRSSTGFTELFVKARVKRYF